MIQWSYEKNIFGNIVHSSVMSTVFLSAHSLIYTFLPHNLEEYSIWGWNPENEFLQCQTVLGFPHGMSLS